MFRGRYNAYRLAQTALVSAMLLCTVGLMVSGIVLSRHVFSFLPINGGRQLARTIHLLCAYWGFVLMSVHLGFHWNRMMGMMRRRKKKESSVSAKLLRSLTAVFVAYGVYAFIFREIGTYMLLQSQFVYFDFEEPLMLFFLDYVAIMGLFIYIGHYAEVLLRGRKKKARS